MLASMWCVCRSRAILLVDRSAEDTVRVVRGEEKIARHLLRDLCFVVSCLCTCSGRRKALSQEIVRPDSTGHHVVCVLCLPAKEAHHKAVRHGDCIDCVKLAFPWPADGGCKGKRSIKTAWRVERTLSVSVSSSAFFRTGCIDREVLSRALETRTGGPEPREMRVFGASTKQASVPQGRETALHDSRCA